VINAQLLHLAARQYGVFSTDQARTMFGVSCRSIGRARQNGSLVEIVPNVVRVASSPLTFDMQCMALHLRFGDQGFLSGWTAARRLGLRKMPSSPIHYTVPGHRRRNGPHWADLHRSDWFDGAADIHPDDHGMHVATPLRMLWGLAASFNQFRFERAAEDAWHLGLVTPTEAAAYLEAHRCRGKNGVSTIERWLERALTHGQPAQSGLEQELIAALDDIGLPEPVRQFPLRLASGAVIHLDIAWPELRLAVEPGAPWWHGGDLGQRRDQARDRECGEVGWLVMRFDDSMSASPSVAARQVERIYRRRQHDLRHTLSVPNDLHPADTPPPATTPPAADTPTPRNPAANDHSPNDFCRKSDTRGH
jgi:hypothetical protein